MRKGFNTNGEEIQEKINKWVIMPHSRFKSIWEFFVIIFMIHTATILPFRLCFYDETDENLDILDSLINYFFVIDITVNLFSAYYD